MQIKSVIIENIHYINFIMFNISTLFLSNISTLFLSNISTLFLSNISTLFLSYTSTLFLSNGLKLPLYVYTHTHI